MPTPLILRRSVRSVWCQVPALHGAVTQVNASSELLHLQHEGAVPTGVGGAIPKKRDDRRLGRREKDEPLVDRRGAPLK